MSDGQAAAIERMGQLAGLARRDADLAHKQSLFDQLSRLKPLTEVQRAQRAALVGQRQGIARDRQSVLDQQTAAQANAASAGSCRHIAHETAQWRAVCTAPDYCRVGKSVVAFDSYALLDRPRQTSPDVKARGTSVLRQGDMTCGVLADAGSHVVSGTSQGSGHVKILDGHPSVKVNGQPVARHDSRCLINCDARGNGGAAGRLVTEQKTGRTEAARDGPRAAGTGTSARLDQLKAQREALSKGLIDFDAPDAMVNFRQVHQVLDKAIAGIQGTPGSFTDYAAQAARGGMGFAKDVVLGAGELVYEGAKAMPKLAQRQFTAPGQLMTMLDAQVLAENIRLGNLTAGGLGQGAIDVGKALVAPVVNPWNRGQYVESLTRGAVELGTLLLVPLKAGKLGQGAKAGEAAGAGGGASTGVGGGGVHVKAMPKRVKPPADNYATYRTHGITEDPSRSPEGRRLIIEYEKLGYSEDEAIRRAESLMKTGSTLPQANPVQSGDVLYKVVPEGRMPSATTEYWATREQIDLLGGLDADAIASRLGLPLESQQAGGFDVVAMQAVRPTIVFDSRIAPTTQNGWSQTGGGIQTLVTDRTAFTSPVGIGVKLP